jgi:hypothetical protein
MTLIRLVRAMPEPTVSVSPWVLGVDEFAAGQQPARHPFPLALPRTLAWTRADRGRARPAAPRPRDQPAAGRSTALFALAAEVPAAILAKTLGIHVQAAIQWQKISAGDWAAYAADVSRRPGHTHGPTGQA